MDDQDLVRITRLEKLLERVLETWRNGGGDPRTPLMGEIREALGKPAEALHLTDKTGLAMLCGAEATPGHNVRIAPRPIDATCEECQAIALGREVRRP